MGLGVQKWTKWLPCSSIYLIPKCFQVEMKYEELNVTSGWVVLRTKHSWNNHCPRCGHRYFINADLKCAEHPQSSVKCIDSFNLVYLTFFSMTFFMNLLHFLHHLDLKNKKWLFSAPMWEFVFPFSVVIYFTPLYPLWHFNRLILLSGIIFPPALFCIYNCNSLGFSCLILVTIKQFLIEQIPFRYS